MEKLGIPATQIQDSKVLDAKLLGYDNVEDFQKDLDILNTPSSAGKRERDKLERDQLVSETQEFLGCVNTIVRCENATQKQKVALFDHLRNAAIILSNHLRDGFDKVGAISLIWNPACVGADDGLSTYIAGWDDGSAKLRFQYAPRKLPISKRSGYRDDSLGVPMFELPEKRTTGDQDG